MGFQILIGIAVGVVLLILQHGAPTTPAWCFRSSSGSSDLGWWYLSSRSSSRLRIDAVNLTDGLDGLAISVFAIAAAAIPRWPPSPATASSPVSPPRAFPAGNGADGLLRRARRRLAQLPLVLMPRNLHGRRRIAGPRRARHRRDPDQAKLLLPIVGSVFCRSCCRSVLQGDGRTASVPDKAPSPLRADRMERPKVITRFVIVGIIFALFSLATLKLR